MSKEFVKENPELVARLRDPATCRDAFGEVIKLYGEPLYWQIRRMVESHEDGRRPSTKHIHEGMELY